MLNSFVHPPLPGAPRTAFLALLHTRWLAGLALIAVALAAPALAQVPRIGADVYADETDLGFKINVPDGWEFVPPPPDDGNLIAKYAPKTNNSVVLSPKMGMNLLLESWLLKFDRREKPKAGEDGGLVRRQHFAKDLAAWIKDNMGGGYAEKPGSTKELTIGKVPAIESVYMKSFGEYDIGLYSMLYKLTPEIDIAVVYIAPGDPKKWGRYEPEFRKLGRSLKKLELKAGKAIVAAGDTLRDKKRALLQKEIANQGDWKLYETPNYFVISNNDDKEFIEQLKVQLEAIRVIYEKDYPAAMAQEIRANAPKTGTGDATADEEKEKETEKEKEEDEAAAKLPPMPKVDPIEASRTSVVRVCKNRELYNRYGGPETSAGFWSSGIEELVIFDDRVAGRNKTWAVLNHEAFHQYIYYFYGNISPHSWYNEGTGDFYSGYKYNRNGQFTLDKFDWRVGTIKEMLNKSKPGLPKYVPLVDFVRMSKKDYYAPESAPNKWGTNGYQCYAQGWSFIWFLRTGEKNHARNWNPRWSTILDDYLRALASSGKVDQAVEQAFTGVDMDELERAWIEYTK